MICDLTHTLLQLVSESASELAQDSREYNKGVVFYMRDRHVVGVLLWNMFGKVQ